MLGTALFACKKGEESASGSGAKRLNHPGSEEGLKALLSANFASSTTKAADVVAALKPDPSDYTAVFESDIAPKVEEHVNTMLQKPPAELGKSGDEVQVWGVTADDLKSESDAAKKCPGGYTRIAPKLKSGTKLYCTKVGTISYDVFAHVNGHWVWFPKAFRALRD